MKGVCIEMKLTNVLITVTTFILIFGCSKSIQLIPFEEDYLWGYKDPNGNVVIPPKYFIAGTFLETGIAAVADSVGWAYIDINNKTLVRPFIVDNGPDVFAENLARFESNSKFGYFDPYGEITINAQWDFARPFSNGLAAVCEGCELKKEGEYTRIENGLWGFINFKGKLVVPIKFQEVKDFANGIGQVYSEGSWKKIDKNGMFLSN